MIMDQPIVAMKTIKASEEALIALSTIQTTQIFLRTYRKVFFLKIIHLYLILR